MTYLSAQQSVEDSEPRELLKIAINDVETHWHTSATRDITYSGAVYTSIAIERGELVVPTAENENDMVVSLPIDHALCRRWTQQAIPPKSVQVTLYVQDGSETEQQWTGFIESMSAEDRIAKFNATPRARRWLARQVPWVQVGPNCPAMVYDSACGVSRTGSHSGLAFKVSTTVISVSGRDVRVDLGSVSRNGTWAQYGELVHTDSGERMTIASQADANPGVSSVAVLTMQAQIVGMQIGDAVDVYAGCDWSIGTCSQRFNNRQNFRGLPNKASSNPFVKGIRGQ